MYVLDTYAVLAWLANEEGADTVDAVLDEARQGRAEVLMTWVNVCEVYYITLRKSVDSVPPETAALRTVGILKELPITLVPADEELSLEAGRVKSRFPIPLADSYAAGLARQRNATLITGDREFQSLENAGWIKIRWIT
ncbi:MAG: type II toxin-antitoxin system VapC family toxin [Armatimonadota bacterium]|nr:type II toxin-antitoxin system VapC family toxin [Armatimonadota bacterium]